MTFPRSFTNVTQSSSSSWSERWPSPRWSSRWEEGVGGRTEAGQWNKWKRVWQSSPFSNQISHSRRLEYSASSPPPSSSSTSSLSSLSDDQFIKKMEKRKKIGCKKQTAKEKMWRKQKISLSPLSRLPCEEISRGFRADAARSVQSQ